jgi:DNA-binding beta-propeller fold protein YncE
MNARRLALAMLLTAVGALLACCAPALALTTHPYLSQLTSFGEPTAVAVASTGDVYVADAGDRVVDRFSSAGVPLGFTASESYVEGSRLTGTPSGAFELPQGVAVNNATGDIYVSDGGGGRHVVDVFSAAGQYLTQLTGTPVSAPVSGEFKDPFGLAVDQADGDLYVTDPHSGVVDVFGASGVYVSQFGEGVLGGTYGESVAVNELTGTAYVGDSATDVVDVFDAAGNLVTPEWSGTGTPDGSFGGGFVYVGMDQSSGHVLVASTAQHQFIGEFNSSTSEEFLQQLPVTPSGPIVTPRAVTISPATGDVYVADGGGFVDIFGGGVVIPDVAPAPASEQRARSVTLNGTVNPDNEGSVTCLFEYGSTAAYGQSAPCSAAVPSGNSPVAVSAGVSGLQSDTTYHFRLKATNANGTNTSQDREFETGGPGIHQEAASAVSSASATLNAAIDPNNVFTTYYFQYGTSVSYGSTVPALPGFGVGSGKGDVLVGIHLQGLTAGRVYHYRVVATNAAHEAVEGEDRVFTTQPPKSGLVLPDGRQWEVVSPQDKEGGLISPISEDGLVQAAAGGGAITYLASNPTEENPAGRALGNQILSVRGAGGGWSSQDIATPHKTAVGPAVGAGEEYRFFSVDLSLGLVEPFGEGDTPLSTRASERTGYVRDDAPLEPGAGEQALYGDAGAEAPEGSNGVGYLPLITPANVPLGTKFGESFPGGVAFKGATPDLSHVVVQSVAALTSKPVEGGLYEWSGGRPALVSVLPGAGDTAVSGQFGGGRSAGSAISADGARIIWTGTDPATGEGHLYLRDMSKGETIQLDVPQPGAKSELAGPSPRFQVANSEGSKIFFTDGQQLTSDSHAGEAEGVSSDLYVVEVSGGSGPLSGTLTDLTKDINKKEGKAESAAVQGSLMGASEDGSYVYFVANGVLGDGAEHGATSGNCTSSEESTVCNLYVLHDSLGSWTTRFVARLSEGDDPDWTEDISGLSARVSPDGSYLVMTTSTRTAGSATRRSTCMTRSQGISSARRVTRAAHDRSASKPTNKRS